MSTATFGTESLKELETEEPASRKCLERIPESIYDWKPHEKSMQLGYLTLLVADIPRWISFGIEQSVIDFATFPQFSLSTTAALLKHYDDNIEKTKAVLRTVTNEILEEQFYLKNSGQVLMKQSKKELITSSINHWVHHRGQLTVYMRLQNIAVPSIYGPSADDRSFNS
jgi:uncharacterized damage-inducible protein DinB